MSSKVAVIGEAPTDPSEGSVKRPGNRGSFLLARTCRKLFPEREVFPERREWTPEIVERLQAEFSHLVIVQNRPIPLNTDVSRHRAYFERLAQNIEKTDLPVVVFTVVVENRGSKLPYEISLPAAEDRFLRMVAERSPGIPVAGAYTAEVLGRAGISNTRIIGCPSCFFSLNRDFPRRLKRPEDVSGDSTVGNYTYPVFDAGLVALYIRHGIDVIGEGEAFEQAVAEGQEDRPGADSERVIRLYERLEQLGHDSAAVDAFLQQHFNQFDSFEAWRTAIQKYRFSLGTRFHGNMMALQQSVPALWVTRDSRSKELTDYLGLPAVPIGSIRPDMPLSDLAELCTFGKFRKVYERNFDAFKKYLDDTGMAHALQ